MNGDAAGGVLSGIVLLVFLWFMTATKHEVKRQWLGVMISVIYVVIIVCIIECNRR